MIPDLALQGRGRQLKLLKNRALIDVLALDYRLSRSAIEVTRIKIKNKYIWARRSTFCFYGQALLVTEAFCNYSPRF